MNLIPEEIRQTVLCCIFCNGHEDENLGTHRELRVAVCTSSGYLLEICDKKILCCLCLPFTDAEQLLSYYHFKTNRLKQYYLVANSHKFVIVKKSENEKLVLKYVMEKQAFQNFVAINECNFLKGKASCLARQIFGFSGSNKEINEILSENREITRIKEANADNHNIVENMEDIGGIASFLSKRLEDVRAIADELLYESHSLNVMFKKAAECSSPSKNYILIRFLSTWFRVHNLHWVIGIEFSCCGIRSVDDIKLTTKCKSIRRWAYRFFGPNCSEWKKSLSAEWHQGEQTTNSGNYTKCVVVLAVDVPAFGSTANIPVDFTFTYGTYQINTDTFSLSAEDVLSKNFCLFREENMLAEDLMACLAAGEEVSLILQAKFSDLPLGDVIVKELEFRRVKLFDENYYVKDNGFLFGTVLCLRRVFNDSASWNLNVTVRDILCVKVLLRALINKLPAPVTVTLGEN